MVERAYGSPAGVRTGGQRMARKAKKTQGPPKRSAWRSAVVIAAAVTAVGGLVAAIVGVAPHFRGSAPPVPGGEITAPETGARIGTTFDVVGRVHAIPEDRIPWIAVQADNLYWPKQRVRAIDGAFVVTTSDGGDAGRSFAIVLLTVSDEGHRAIERWLTAGRAAGTFAGLDSIPGMSILDAHVVAHD